MSEEDAFCPGRLTLARRRRGMTKVKLATALGLSVRTISGYEAGETGPTAEKLQEVARVLHFPVSFFKDSRPLEMPALGAASFRALKTMTASQRDSALAAGALAVSLADWMAERFNLPAAAVPDLRDETPEGAAEALRASWGLGQRPVKNLVHLLEAKGVRVFSLALDCRKVDAFSMWRGNTPFVFLNTGKSAERGRFDAAHELGHLCLHQHGGPHGRLAERQADAFASAFLMPRASVLATAPRLPSIADLVVLKRNWNVSVAALVRRLFSIGLISDWHYRELCTELSQLGYRRAEPNGIARETSQLLRKMFEALRDQGMSRADVARAVRIFPADLDALVFGLVLTAMEGGHPGSPGPARAKLHVV